MGEDTTPVAVAPPFSRRSKQGLVLGALVGAMLLRQVQLPLAFGGWILGGIIGAEVFEAEEDEDISLVYSVVTLSYSLLVMVSEYALLGVVSKNLPIDIVVGTIGLITLLIFLSFDDVTKNGYNLLMIFGIFGLITLAVVPVTMDGSNGNGPPTETTGPSPTITGPSPTITGPSPTITGPSPTTTKHSPTPDTNKTAYDPEWLFSIRFVDDTTYRYYARNWRVSVVGNVASYERRQAAYENRTVLNSSNVSRLVIEQQPNGTWLLRTGFGRDRMVASRWRFVPQNVSISPQRSGVFADELHIYDQRDISEFVIRRPLPVYQLPSVEDRGIQSERTQQQQSGPEQQKDENRTAADGERDTVEVPPFLYLVYGGLFLFGGLLWLQEYR